MSTVGVFARVCALSLTTTTLLMDTAPLTHEQLLTLARKVQAAAHDNDPERLESSRLRLFEALTAHLDAEHDALSRLPEPQRDVVARGQRRLVDLLGTLAQPAQGQPLRTWSRVADELLDSLGLQAGDERRSLRADIAVKRSEERDLASGQRPKATREGI
jgi:hypothetical protein